MAILSGVLGIVNVAVFGVVMFACAGRWDLPLYWAYLGVWMAALLIGSAVVDPTLIQERIRPGAGGKDFLTAVAFAPLWLCQCALAALDVGRLHWSDTVPPAVQFAGLVAMAAALAVIIWATVVNRFFSAVIRIQTDRGHHVVSSGPYRFVRHPGYAVSSFLLIGSGLALGSWLAAIFGLLLFFPVLRRTAWEDRVLHEQLDGYAAYARKVRYRVCPGVW
jgi:protein-S-isoprenylcysteine O-methyltransferase Ste14